MARRIHVRALSYEQLIEEIALIDQEIGLHQERLDELTTRCLSDGRSVNSDPEILRQIERINPLIMEKLDIQKELADADIAANVSAISEPEADHE